MAGFLWVAGTGLLLWGLYILATRSEERAKSFREAAENPVGMLSAVLMVISGLAFFWGIVVPSLGTAPVWLFGVRFQVWHLGGIGFLVFLGLLNLSLKRS